MPYEDTCWQITFYLCKDEYLILKEYTSLLSVWYASVFC